MRKVLFCFTLLAVACVAAYSADQSVFWVFPSSFASYGIDPDSANVKGDWYFENLSANAEDVYISSFSYSTSTVSNSTTFGTFLSLFPIPRRGTSGTIIGPISWAGQVYAISSCTTGGWLKALRTRK